MSTTKEDMLSKVPEVTLIFWIIKILATTLGETGGDAVTMSTNLGYRYGGSAVVFGAMLAVIAAAYYRTKLSHTVLFWAAFILTRPLGAVVGDFLDKPIRQGGLSLSRYSASATLLALIVFLS